MKPEEAIETIKVAIAEVEWGYPMDYTVAFEEAIEALEKQVPKKLKNICNYSKRYRGGKCKCGFFVTEHMHTYCPSCGQRLDWGE